MTTAESWHEDEQFWETMREAMFPPEKFEEAPGQVDAVLDLADVPEDASVLDVPCGPGRHSLAFARRGFDVTGVDATAPYVEEAQERAHDADDLTGDAEFVEADMREFVREESFDLAVNLYTSFGYFEDREDDERVARNLYDSLKPGGALVMHLASKETLARDFQARTWDDHGDGYVLEDHSVTDDWSWMTNEWVVVADGETGEFDVSHRLYSAYELKSLLEDVGFSDVSAYGDLEGSVYDETADALVVVARK
jgi:SAM-dependent methyltransferase